MIKIRQIILLINSNINYLNSIVQLLELNISELNTYRIAYKAVIIHYFKNYISQSIRLI